jgi:hypothetical protein
LEKLYQGYKDIAKMYIVYVREAHAADSSWPVEYAKELNITEPKKYEERCTVAERLVAEGKLTIPCLIDGMDNAVNDLHKGNPTRIFLIRKDGKLGVAGSKGPFGLVPSIEATHKWLKEYKESGKEPEIDKKTTEKM